MSFTEYQNNKSKSWFARVKPKKKDAKKNTDVMINIGLLAWNEKQGCMKPLRGKKVTLRLPVESTYNDILTKGEARFNDFYKNLLKIDAKYVLTFENGEKALFIPGTVEAFKLNRYKEELGKDYKSITLFLMSKSDQVVLLKLESSPFNVDNDEIDNDEKLHPELERKSDDFIPACKKQKCEEQEKSDFLLAQSLQENINEDLSQSGELPKENVITSESCPTELRYTNVSSVIAELQKKIIKEKQFFLSVRRGASIERRLTLWNRENKKNDVHNRLMVAFSGEKGIDADALHKEFLTDIIKDMRSTIFVNGAPRDSMLDIQNGNIFTCGQIAAVSLLQGGPPPCLFQSNIFDIMLAPEINLRNLDVQKHFVGNESKLFLEIEENPLAFSDMILENGYTGVIKKENSKDIVGTVMIGITTRRLALLAEFARGLELFDLLNNIKSYKELFQTLFVNDKLTKVNANYVFSLFQPVLSSEATSKRIVEEAIMDHLQDFLMYLEDENVTGYSEALAFGCEEEGSSVDEKLNKEQEQEDDSSEENIKQEQDADLSPAGIMQWLTGQSHKPFCDEDVYITLSFNHDCKKENPDHTICFPVVHACSKELVLPCLHMKTYEEFKHVFLLAFCKGQAFGRE